MIGMVFWSLIPEGSIVEAPGYKAGNGVLLAQFVLIALACLFRASLIDLLSEGLRQHNTAKGQQNSKVKHSSEWKRIQMLDVMR